MTPLPSPLLSQKNNMSSVTLTQAESDALTQCYVLCKGFKTISAAGPLSRYVAETYPGAGFDLLAAAFIDIIQGSAGPSATKLERLADGSRGHAVPIRQLAKSLRQTARV